MTKPTLDEDLTWLANICDQANANETRSHACEAVARIRAALAEREHLLMGARLLRHYIGQDISHGYFVAPDRDEWIRADRARVGRGG